jgi:hypothetical protein
MPSWGDMREADMKCKVAAWLLPIYSRTETAWVSFHLHSFPLAGRLTRSRKVAAECIFCYESGAGANCALLSLRSSFLPNLSYFRDNVKNEGGKLAAENFVGENDEK